MEKTKETGWRVKINTEQPQYSCYFDSYRKVMELYKKLGGGRLKMPENFLTIEENVVYE